ncbi:MAG: protein kinase, partial [Acutalibacteraceae bacterium]
MPQSFDPVFDNWYTEKQLGFGTDGKVYSIIKENPDGTKSRSILKTIRISDNRSSGRDFNSVSGDDFTKSQDLDEIIKNITDNIDVIKETDGGKHFVKYEQWAVRKTSDGKGRIIMIRLEQMRSLTSLLNDFSFTLEETYKLGISVCKALVQCRKFGYIYPNLKPENILFDRRGVCKLGDFGSFSCLEPSKTSIAFKRTQYYMAPEFIRTGKINCTADTYSLGLVLYSLVNRGRLPFVEKYPQEVTVNGLDRSMKLRLEGKELEKPALCSDELFKIIAKACAQNESDRYLTPKQMLRDLKAAAEGKPFEKVEYDDVYSVSEPPKLQEEDDEKSGKASDEEMPLRQEASQAYEAPPISLHSEIQIPDVTPSDYVS